MTSPLTCLFASLFLLFAVPEGWLGVYLDAESTAPRISECVPGSPAQKAGLRVGDVIVAMGAAEFRDVEQFRAAIRAQKAGDEVELRVRRDGKVLEVKVVLGERPAEGGVPAEPATPSDRQGAREPAKRPATPSPAPAPESRGGKRPSLGISVVEEHSALRVTAVRDDSVAQRAGFRVGDVIEAAGDRAVHTHADLVAAIERGATQAFAVRRGDERIELRAEFGDRAGTAARARESAAAPSSRLAPEPEDPAMPLLRDYDAAMAAAEEAGLAVVVIYGADGDGPTQALERAFEHRSVQEALEGYVAVYVDRAANPELHASRKVKDLPVLEIRKGDRTTFRHDGFLPPEALRAALRDEQPNGAHRATPVPAVPPGPRPVRIRTGNGDLEAEVERLRAEVRALEVELKRLRAEAERRGR